ncbi:MAG: DUF374 domain-containing protein [Alphaproteobacteria bacterium]|nr:DUF374 domain-containing protein [Alphaproteobacteria bacterium]
MLKRFLASAAGTAIVSALVAAYVRLVLATTSWRIEGREHIEARFADPASIVVVAFWHGRLGAMVGLWRCLDHGRPVAVLSSTHRDGRISAATMRRLGLEVVDGSSRRGGSEGLRRMISWLRGGRWAAITPDGPRGPRMRAQPGVLMMARMAGAPVLPVAFSTTRGRTLGSWDGLLLPLPFGRGVYVVGRPIVMPRETDQATLEALRLEVEAALTAVTREADRLCGRETPEPAPPR